MSRCRKIDGVFIPGCAGGAINGKAGCTCPSLADSVDAHESRIAELEHLVAKLANAFYRSNPPKVGDTSPVKVVISRKEPSG